MTHVADEDVYEDMVKEFSNDITDALQEAILTMSDNWLARKIRTLEEEPDTADQEDAALFYALALTLRRLFNANSDESVTADWYEEQADDCLGLGDSEGKGANYYASSQTISDTNLENRRTYRRRPLRYTTEIDNISEFEV